MAFNLAHWQLASLFAGAAFLVAILIELLINRKRRARRILEVFRQELERYNR